MNPVSPLPAVFVLLLAIATSTLLMRRFGAPAAQGRFAAIDGLRGYLALSVFLHHAGIWYFYLRSGEWQVPPSHLYTHLGQSSVALFFMITGFLFFSKLLRAREHPIDWSQLFASRLLRLGPLYLFAVCIVFAVVACLSRGVLRQPLPALAADALQWIGFTIGGMPDLNGVAATSLIMASASWSLPYEWLFYLLLPILALLMGLKPPLAFRALGVLGLAWLISWQPHIYLAGAFAAGMAAARCARSERIGRFACGLPASVIVLACVAGAVFFYPTSYAVAPLVCLSVAFILIASGNGLFGALLSPVSRTLGELAYSIYLLHGIVLFVTFRFIIGFEQARQLSASAHWAWIAALVPVLIGACFVTFRLIERPAMRQTERLAALFRTPLDRLWGKSPSTPLPGSALPGAGLE